MSSCKLNGENLKLAADWVDQYRAFWEESFDRLELYLKTVTTEKKGKKHVRINKKAAAKPNEIYLERLYDAPVETVWNAWLIQRRLRIGGEPRGLP